MLLKYCSLSFLLLETFSWTISRKIQLISLNYKHAIIFYCSFRIETFKILFRVIWCHVVLSCRFINDDNVSETVNFIRAHNALAYCGLFCFLTVMHFYPVPDRSGDGVLFSIDFFVYIFVSFFLSFFVSLLARLRENGWTDLHEIFREGVEWPWDDVITFLVNSEKPRDAQHGDGVCCASFDLDLRSLEIVSRLPQNFAWWL